MWKEKWEKFYLWWLSLGENWNMWYFNKANFQHKTLNRGRKPTYWTTMSKDLCLVWFCVLFGRTSSQLAALNMILLECEQLLEFPVEDEHIAWIVQKAYILYSQCNKKLLVYQRIGADVVPPTCNFLKIEAASQVFFVCKFGKFF